ncbi:hypothetical protein GCM10009641_26220 [Mycobacterium cookii]
MHESAACSARFDPNQILYLEDSQCFSYGGPTHLGLLDQVTLRRQGDTLDEFATENPFAKLAGEHVRCLGYFEWAEFHV